MTTKIQTAVIEIVTDWLKYAEENYGLPTRKEDRPAGPKPKGERDCQNEHLAYEADVKVKLGGYLELELRKRGSNFSVHSELSLFKNKGWRADLSVHELGGPWSRSQKLIDSCRAVIEIKYANYWNPDYAWDGKGNTVVNDLIKLNSIESAPSTPKEEVLKVLLVIDEGHRISENLIGKLREQAGKDGIIILSNRSDIFYLAAR